MALEMELDQDAFFHAQMERYAWRTFNPAIMFLFDTGSVALLHPPVAISVFLGYEYRMFISLYTEW